MLHYAYYIRYCSQKNWLHIMPRCINSYTRPTYEATLAFHIHLHVLSPMDGPNYGTTAEMSVVRIIYSLDRSYSDTTSSIMVYWYDSLSCIFNKLLMTNIITNIAHDIWSITIVVNVSSSFKFLLALHTSTHMPLQGGWILSGAVQPDRSNLQASRM